MAAAVLQYNTARIHQKWFYAPYCIVEMFFQLI